MDAIGAAVSGIALFHFIVIADDNVSRAGTERDGASRAKNCAMDVDSFRLDRFTVGKCESPADLWCAVLAFIGIVGCVIVDGVAAPPSSR